MKRNLPLILIWFFIVIAPVFGKDAWTKVQSKNFTLVGNASEGDMRKIAFKLEQFRQTLTLILPKAGISILSSRPAWKLHRPGFEQTRC